MARMEYKSSVNSYPISEGLWRGQGASSFSDKSVKPSFVVTCTLTSSGICLFSYRLCAILLLYGNFSLRVSLGCGRGLPHCKALNTFSFIFKIYPLLSLYLHAIYIWITIEAIRQHDSSTMRLVLCHVLRNTKDKACAHDSLSRGTNGRSGELP